MKLKEGFELRTVAGEAVLVATGIDNVDFSKIITLNHSAAYLWEEVAKLDFFSVELLADLLIQKYEIDLPTAEKDAEMITKKWMEAGLSEQ